MIDHQLLIDIGLSPDRETLTTRLIGAAEAMGFGLMSGLFVRGRLGSPNALVKSVGNPPQAFSDATRSLELGLRDPVATRLLARPGYMTYGQDLYVQAGATDLWDLQSSFGYRHGLVTSMHSPSHAEVFYFGVDRPDALPTNPGELLHLQSLLHVVAMHTQVALLNQVASDQPVMSPIEAAELTKQEVDALQRVTATVYASRGPFVAISDITSPDLRMAEHKLHAQSLPEAVLRAIQKGIVER